MAHAMTLGEALKNLDRAYQTIGEQDREINKLQATLQHLREYLDTNVFPAKRQ